MAAVWKALVLQHVDTAEDSLDSVLVPLRDAVASLESPMQVAGGAEAAKTRALQVWTAVSNTSSRIASATAAALAAELVALRGAAASPTAPLGSAADIPDDHRTVRLALDKLRSARDYADAAYNGLQLFDGRLLTVYNLLDHPGIPAVDGIIDAERVAARGHLMAAENHVRFAAAFANTALELLKLP